MVLSPWIPRLGVPAVSRLGACACGRVFTMCVHGNDFAFHRLEARIRKWCVGFFIVCVQVYGYCVHSWLDR